MIGHVIGLRKYDIIIGVLFSFPSLDGRVQSKGAPLTRDRSQHALCFRCPRTEPAGIQWRHHISVFARARPSTLTSSLAVSHGPTAAALLSPACSLQWRGRKPVRHKGHVSARGNGADVPYISRGHRRTPSSLLRLHVPHVTKGYQKQLTKTLVPREKGA